MAPSSEKKSWGEILSHSTPITIGLGGPLLLFAFYLGSMKTEYAENRRADQREMERFTQGLADIRSKLPQYMHENRLANWIEILRAKNPSLQIPDLPR